MTSAHQAIPEAVLRSAIGGYTLYPLGTHGLGHWGRVLENGLRLAERTGADLFVVSLFAVLHDCRRENEGTDPGHGKRGARVLVTLEDQLPELTPARSELLRFACAHHTDGEVHEDPTIGTCWDSDRLDLGRVGIQPVPELLCTGVARQPSEIAVATRRAIHAYVPSFVEDEWLHYSSLGG